MSELIESETSTSGNGWDRLPLGHLGSFTNGINKSGADFGFGVPFINLLDVFGVSSIRNAPEGLVNATEQEITRYKLQIGDVLFIRSSVKPEGVGLTAVVLRDMPRIIYCGFLIRFQPESNRFSHDFLKYCFYTDDFRRRLIARSTVSANTNINQDSLRQLELDVPPLPEQRKIARILTTVDNLIEKTEALIAKYQAIKQGMMHDLFTRGVDEDGHLRPPYQEAPELYKQSELGWIPKDWEVRFVKDVAETITSGSRGWAAYYSDEGAVFVRIGNLTREHINFRWEGIQRVRPPRSSEGERTALKRGDVLVSVTADLGIVGVVPNGMEESYINQHIAMVRLQPNTTNPRWLGRFLAGRMGREQFDRLNDSGAKAGLNLPAVGSLRFLDTPKDEQEFISTVLDRCENQIEIEKGQLAKYHQIKTGLMQDLLTGKVRLKVDETELAPAHV